VPVLLSRTNDGERFRSVMPVAAVVAVTAAVSGTS
jgi:hypothetical protein